MEKNAKIYVAGHTGMVGSAVVRRLNTAGFANLVLKGRGELDLFDQAAVRSFFATERPQYVIDCAARVGGIKANMEHQADFLYENLEIQNNIIWSSHLFGVKKLLFLGSSCIYPRQSPQPIREEYLLSGELEPTNEGYALAKIAGMKLCEHLFEQYGKTFVSCMPTNVYGENDNFDPDTSHVISALMGKMHAAKVEGLERVSVWGSGKARREFLYVDDLADAVLWIMEHYDGKQFLNVGTGEDISIFDLAHLIREVVGYAGALVFDSTRPDGMMLKRLDVGAIQALGWKHTVGLKEGLEKTYRSFLQECV